MKMKNTQFFGIGGFAVIFVFFFLCNVVAQLYLPAYRMDFTYNKAFTLAAGSKNIIAKLQEPILIRFYFSKKLAKGHAAITGFAQRTKELLSQYEKLSNGKIKVLHIDPQAFSEEEDQALNYGLQGIPVDQQGNELYLGLVATNSTTGQLVLPLLQLNQEPQLEYEITQLLDNLQKTASVKVGVISAVNITGAGYNHPMMMQKPWAIWEHISQNFSTQVLSQDFKEIPKDIEILLLVDPSKLEPLQVYAVEQFVLRGGRLLAFVDPYVEVSSSYDKKQISETANNFTNLLATWGITLSSDQVVACIENAKKVVAKIDNKESVVNYPLWMDIPNKYFNNQDMILNGLEKLTFASPGALTVNQDSQATIVPLIRTSDRAMLVERHKIAEYQQDPNLLLQNYNPQGSYILAARVQGKLKSAFAEASDIINIAKDQHISSTENAQIVLVADVDMLHDHFWVSKQNLFGQSYASAVSGNGNFVLNSLDNLSGSDDLIAIRNRGGFARYFDVIRELEKDTQTKFKEKESLLQEKIQTARKKLALLDEQNNQDNDSKVFMQKKQEQDSLRQELLVTRKTLREVRHKLNKNIEKIEHQVKFFGIMFMPMITMLLFLTRNTKMKKGV